MIPELGQFALILALLVGARAGHAAARRRAAPRRRADGARAAGRARAVRARRDRVRLPRVVASSTNDFSVAERRDATRTRSCRSHYRIAATWGAHEGSLLLWVLMLAGWTLRGRRCEPRNLPDDDGRARARRDGPGQRRLPALPAVHVAIRSSACCPPAADGRDLNPLLQDPGMVIHPPMLYMGYVGFSVAFAFAIAALLGGRLDATWARWSRPWTHARVVLPHLGIALGSWWAYYELGWGGWWFWDPVENASFMPWLVGTALIHSLAVTEKRGTFKSWTVLLAIVAFSLSLLGTFLVRSGVLTSVHAFATDPRARRVHPGVPRARHRRLARAVRVRAPARSAAAARFEPVSRESLLLANNVLLVVACASGAARHAVSAVPRRARPRQDLGRPAVLRRGVRAADGAARVPDGRRPARALEARRRCPTCGQRLRLGARASASSRRSSLPFAAGQVDAAGARSACCSPRGSSRRRSSIVVQRLRGARRRRWSRSSRASRGATGHDRRAPRRRGVHRRRDAGQGLRDRARRAHGLGDTVTVGGYTFRFDGVDRDARPELPRGARAPSTCAGTASSSTTLHPGEARLQREQQPMTEAAIDTGLARRPLRLARRAGRRAAALERARLPQAVRRLDLGRLLPDGARRIPRAVRPPLSPRGAARGRRRRRRRGAAARTPDDEHEAADPARRLRRARRRSCWSGSRAIRARCPRR